MCDYKKGSRIKTGVFFCDRVLVFASHIRYNDRKLFQRERRKTVMKKIVFATGNAGLEVDAVNGEPGVYSARYMGEDTSYRIKNQSLVDRLEGVPVEKRTARFVCVIAAAFPDGTVCTTKGTIEGKIGYEERGENGFGYDPIFYLPDMSRTTAELSPEEKNAVSHRGKALAAMKEQIASYLK